MSTGVKAEDSSQTFKAEQPEHTVEVGRWTLIPLTTITVLLLVVVLFTLFRVQFVSKAPTPKVVLSLFEDLVSTDYATFTLEDVLPKYLESCEDGLFDWSPVYPMEWVAFRRTLWNHGQTPTSFEVVRTGDGYVEVQLFDSAGTKLYPLVGFFYQLTEDKAKIADYTLCRLEPFSRYDEEYNKEWLLR